REPTGARTSVRITPRTAKGNEPIWHRGTSRRWSEINSALRENLRAPGSAIRHRVKYSNQALNLCVFSKEPSRSKRVIPVGQTTKPAKQKGTIGGLNNDNTCAGCHSPTRGFGDTQSIAIGVVNNGIVGPDRRGPRNQRRTPMAINTAFYPNLMWNSRFASLADDPFDNSAGFQFPPPESFSLSYLPHLLVAQAFIPPTERVEVAGFDFPGDNDAIRAEVLRRLNAIPAYRTLFGN